MPPGDRFELSLRALRLSLRAIALRHRPRVRRPGPPPETLWVSARQSPWTGPAHRAEGISRGARAGYSRGMTFRVRVRTAASRSQ